MQDFVVDEVGFFASNLRNIVVVCEVISCCRGRLEGINTLIEILQSGSGELIILARVHDVIAEEFLAQNASQHMARH